MRRVGFVALVLVAGVVGGVAGWRAAWLSSAIAAATFVLLAGGLWWVRNRLNAVRKHQRSTYRLIESLLRQQKSLHRHQKAVAAAVSAAGRAQRAETRHAHRSVAKAVGGRTNALAKQIEHAAEQEADRSRRQADRMFRQLEALQNLYQLIRVRRAMPPSRGWALSPDVLLSYVEEILRSEPRTVLECGSGASTVWAAYAVELLGSGRVVALEHDQEFAERTRTTLAGHGLADVADVRLAPIAPIDVPAGTWQWYDTAALHDLHDIDLVLIDGPPKPTHRQARYPAVPVLRDRLAPGAVLLLDDADRPDERAILHRWRSEWPELTWNKLPHEKGTARLVVPRA